MTNVKLHIVAQNDVKVGSTYPPSAAGYLADELFETIINVDAGHNVTTQQYYFQAPGTDSGKNKIELIRVTIDDWDADLSYMLTNVAAEADPPFATYDAKVLPQ